MVGEFYIMDAVMLQGLKKASSVEVVFGDSVFPVEFPKLFVQGVIHLMEVMGTGNAEVFEMVLVVDTLESHLGGSIEIPKCPVEVEEDVFVLFLPTSDFCFLTSTNHLPLPFE